MKKSIGIILLIAIFVSITPVSARATFQTSIAPGTWASSINIQNPTNPTNASATVTLTFYDSTGIKVLEFTVAPPIPAGGSRSLYVPADIGGLSSGQFSVVARSDVDVNIVVNSSSTSPYTAGSYTGLKADGDIGTALYYPGLYNNYYGFSSEIVIQNTDISFPANIQIQFFNQRTGAAVGPIITETVPGGSSKAFPLSEVGGLPTGNTNGLFSAKVTSTNGKSLAGIANIWTAALRGSFADYNAFVDGATSTWVPALYKNYFGFVSSLTVQNIESTMANVTITYSNGVTVTTTLAPNQAAEFFQPNNPQLPSGNTQGVFSAKIVSDKKIVTLVNIEDKTRGLLASYNGAKNPSPTVLCPVVLKEFYQWFSAQTVQNVGTLATNITITYANGNTRAFNNILPNGTVNIIELNTTGSVLPSGSSLAATITSHNGQPLVAVVQQNSNERNIANPGDYLLSYTCANQ